MPWPALPLPRSVEILPPFRAITTFGFEQGYEARRAVSTRHLREVVLIYTLATDNVNVLMSYMLRDLDDGKDTFDGWTMPERSVSGRDTNASRLISVVNGVCAFLHPQTYTTGDWLYINSPPIDGAFRIANATSSQTFILENTTINSTGLGRARLHFPKAAVVLNEGRVPAPRQLIGPTRDDKGLFELIVNLQERL